MGDFVFLPRGQRCNRQLHDFRSALQQNEAIIRAERTVSQKDGARAVIVAQRSVASRIGESLS